MAGYPNAFSTTRDEYMAIGDTGASIPGGHAVKLVRLPVGLSGTDVYHVAAAAGTTDKPYAVASFRNTLPITPAQAGRVTLLTSAFVLVKMDTLGSKGDGIAVTTSDGKWGTSATPVLRLAEDCAAGDLAWAERITV